LLVNRPLVGLKFRSIELDPVPSKNAFWPVAHPRRGSSCLMEGLMSTGTVKWFNSAKGDGFIQPEDGSKDIFVHISAVERAGLSNLHEGQKLTFDVERGQQGKVSAVNIQAAWTFGWGGYGCPVPIRLLRPLTVGAPQIVLGLEGHELPFATRYDRNALNYLAMIKIAVVPLWLRFYESAA
jgi:cold shock protein